MLETKEQRSAKPCAPNFVEALKVWFKIGLLGFGGPAGQIAWLHKEIVENRGWVSEQRFLHALHYCLLLPGPEAQQLAIYIGWLLHRTWGGLAAGLLFVLPGAWIMLGLSLTYVLYRQTHLMDALFLGIKPAVLALVVDALLRMRWRLLKNTSHILLAITAFLSLFLLHLPFPAIILAAGLIGWAFHISSVNGSQEQEKDLADHLFAQGDLAHTQPSLKKAFLVIMTWLPLWLGPCALLAIITGPSSIWSHISGFFSTAALVTFGGAYAVLSYVAQAAVDHFQWLTPNEMVDGLGLAETTPGPLILVLQFVGFLATFRQSGAINPILAGCLGALLTTWVTFAPCFLWIFLGGPYMEKLRHNTTLTAALSGVSAAVMGVIMNLAFWFALHVIFHTTFDWKLMGLHIELPHLNSIDWRTSLLTFIALIAMVRFQMSLFTTLAICAVGGLILSYGPPLFE